MWAASYDPFGQAAINDDVDGDGNAVTFNLRFPGQYYDSETGLHYNYFRYYDPQTGRYITSDPIGLQGGLNTFGYVGGNPINLTDPLGLVGWHGQFYNIGGSIGLASGTHWKFTLMSDCVNGKKMKIRVTADVFGPEYSLPVGTSGGNISFNDGLNSINPSGFSGTVLITSSTIAWGIGYSWTAISFNDGEIIYNDSGAMAGVDLAVFGEMYGRSDVEILGVYDCACEK